MLKTLKKKKKRIQRGKKALMKRKQLYNFLSMSLKYFFFIILFPFSSKISLENSIEGDFLIFKMKKHHNNPP